MREPYRKSEIIAGAFVIVGVGALAYLSVSIAGLSLIGGDTITVSARFASVGALKVDAPVKIAGVTIGRVRAIRLEDYVAQTALEIRRDVPLPADTIASIRTEGLLGESYVLLRPGASEQDLQPGARISQTEPAIDLIDLVVKYALGKGHPEED